MNDYVDGVLLVDPEEKIADCYGVAGISLGILSGWILERRLIDFSMDVSAANKVLRAVFGTVVVIAAARVTKGMVGALGLRFAAFSMTYVMFLTEMFIWPAIFHAVEKCFRRTPKR